MILRVIAPWKLRLAALATATAEYQEIFRYLRLEPSGRVVGTDGLRIVIADDTVEPFEGEPRHIRFAKNLPKYSGRSGWALHLDKGVLETHTVWLPFNRSGKREHFGADGLPLNDNAPDYPDYERILPQQIGLECGRPAYETVARAKVNIDPTLVMDLWTLYTKHTRYSPPWHCAKGHRPEDTFYVLDTEPDLFIGVMGRRS